MQSHAKDIMAKKIVTIIEGSTLMDAHELMKEKRIRHLPVINEKKEITGILSKKDLIVSREFLKIPVEQAMTTPIFFVGAETPLRQTIIKMLENKISSVIVVDSSNEAVGIITSDDLLWHLASKLKDEKSDASIWDAFKLSTIGQIAHQLSQSGI